jgi:uncharacterized protein (TIGR03067 family)
LRAGVAPFNEELFMSKILTSTAFFALASLVTVSAGEKGAPKIDGSWIATGAVAKGKKITEEQAAKAMVQMTFKNGKFTVSICGEMREAGTYKLNVAAKPVAIDMMIDEGRDKGKTRLGILKLEGEMLTIAIVDTDVKTRPKGFEGAEDVEVTFFMRA